MEKIEFFRPRCIEHDGSISVGFWMCENKKVEDGYFYRASDVDALLQAVARLVEAAKDINESFDELWYDLHAEQVKYFEKAIAEVERLLGGNNGMPMR